MSETNAVEFSDSLMAYIKEWKEKPGNLIMVLHRVQEELGYIPREAAEKVAELLDVPLAKIWGVITFYHFFKLTKPGKNNISLCLGTACYLKGAEKIADEVQKDVGIKVGEVTPDGKFSIEIVRCLGCCGLAPVMAISGEVFGKLTPSAIKRILKRFD